MKYNIYLKTSMRTRTLLNLSEENLKSLVNAYDKGEESVMIKGDVLWLDNIHSIRIYTFDNPEKESQFVAYWNQDKFIERSFGYYSCYRKEALMMAGKDVTEDYITGSYGQAILEEIRNEDKLIPLELFDTARSYVKDMARQVNICYQNACYDAAQVMLRKLIETLIIECFERHQKEGEIKNAEGNYLYLSDLITVLLNESVHGLNIGRNSKTALPKIKQSCDMSAHNRHFLARKGDIDDFKTDARIIIEELLHLIDYPEWNKQKKS